MNPRLPILRALAVFIMIAGGQSVTAAPLSGVGLTVGINDEGQKKLRAKAEDHPFVEYYLTKNGSTCDVIARLMLSRENDKKEIDYLAALRNGGSLEGGGEDFNVNFPSFDLKIVNNGSATVYFSEVLVQVASSEIDPTPLLMISQPIRPLQLGLDNQGWGPIERCSVRFNITDSPLSRPPEAFSFEQKFGRFEKELTVDLSRELQQSGIPEEYIVKLRKAEFHAKQPEWQKLCDELNVLRKKLPGKFYNPSSFEDANAYVRGVVNYAWRDKGGHVREQSNPFEIRSTLVPGEYGGGSPTSGSYETMLRRDGSNYVLSLPISQSVAKNAVSRFTIRLGIPCTSAHRLTFKLRTTTGATIDSPPVTIRALLPRHAVEFLRKRDR